MNRSSHDSGIPKVEIYTWQFCPFCIRAKALLNEKGVKFTEYSIDGDNDARTKKTMMQEQKCLKEQVVLELSHKFLSMKKVLEVAMTSTNLKGITN